jgi:hypothetical protein
LLLAHPSSLSLSFLRIGRCVCYSSRRSPSLKKLDSSAPSRPQRYYGIKCSVLGASAKWAIIGHRLRAANFGESRTREVLRVCLLRTWVKKRRRRWICFLEAPGSLPASEEPYRLHPSP